MKPLRERLTYANVLSTLCLFLALGGGTAFAATQLPRNSVGARQLKKAAVTPEKLSSTAASGLRGVPGSPGASGPIGPTGPVGPMGPQGSQGDKGEQGAKGEVGEGGPAGQMGPKGQKGENGEQGMRGKAGLHTTVNSEFVPKESERTVTVDCPIGEYATGGGAYLSSEGAEVLFSGPLPASQSNDGHPVGWQVRYFTGARQGEVYVTAICGPG